MAALAERRRYEEAALVRDRAAALAAALRRQRGLRALRGVRPGAAPPARWGRRASSIDGVLARVGRTIAGAGRAALRRHPALASRPAMASRPAAGAALGRSWPSS